MAGGEGQLVGPVRAFAPYADLEDLRKGGRDCGDHEDVVGPVPKPLMVLEPPGPVEGQSHRDDHDGPAEVLPRVAQPTSSPPGKEVVVDVVVEERCRPRAGGGDRER